MKLTQFKRLCWAAFLLLANTTATAAPGNLASQPLYLGSTVKHNVILSIDDSGSMDWELLLDNNNGIMYLDTIRGRFTDNNGNFLTDGTSYAYLFPNGFSSSYNGRKLYSNQSGSSPEFSFLAVPPIKSYAFTRSAAFNRAYYDPEIEYQPWPAYGGYNFGNVSTTATPFEPLETNLSTLTIDLFNNFNTNSNPGSNFKFDIRASNMICTDTGDTCGLGEKDYQYFPGTYYLKDNTRSYSYLPGGTRPPIASAANSVLLEAEDGVFSVPFRNSLDLIAGTNGGERNALNVIVQTASNNLFAGTFNSESDFTTSRPINGEVNYAFDRPGRVKIWLRVYAFDGNHDSFWIKLQGFNENSPGLTLGPADRAVGRNEWDGDWNKFRDGLQNPPGQWHWIEWAEVDMPNGSQTLSIKHRESATYVDQLLITTNLNFVPSGPLVLQPPLNTNIEIRECNAGTPSHYDDFIINPGNFSNSNVIGPVSGIDAIAPDGSCLVEFKITGSDSDNFANGSIGRPTVTVAQEKQNFANWFTYYRRRHQAMRGAIGSAFQGIGGIQTGIFWFNDQRDVTMFDMDQDDGVEDFLDAHYTHVRSNGTPLRTALKFAGDQFSRTGNNAPITQACQKNFTLLFTDGFTSSDDFNENNVDNVDEDAGVPYADTYENTAADIALQYFTDNPRTDITDTGRVNIPSECAIIPLDKSLDCNSNLHVNTYTVGLGAKGTLFGVTHNNVADAYATPPAWPDVNVASDSTQIDDLYHAAVNGRGEIFNADTPEALNQQLQSALLDIIERIGSGSGVTFNTSSLQNDSLIFTSLFNSPAWGGDLIAKMLDPDDGSVDPSSVWNAAALLDSRNLMLTDRVILTSGNSDGVAFRLPNLTSSQLADLNTAPNGTNDSDAQARLDFIRGDRSNENRLRSRSGRMGDIINSEPVFVGVPASGWPNAAPFGVDDNRFTDFKDKTLADGGASDRTPAIYIGANDGMLHGFNATASTPNAGQEILAFIPNSVYSSNVGAGLHHLSDPSFIHRYYVDLTPVAQDVYIKRQTAGTADWRTIVVGGLRGGGRGLFALDVTNPAEFSEAGTTPADLVLWEFDSSDDSDLGFITSPPIITMMANNKWAVIFGNGYNSDSGIAKLFIVFIEEGIDGVWAASDYREISTNVGNVSDSNGLSGVAVADLNRDGVADRVYAGDLRGNIWAFDLSDSDPINWAIAHQDAGNPAPLFTGTGPTPLFTRQAITGAPNLAINTQVTGTASQPNVLVTFGTGQYLVPGDQTNTETQSYYTVWDSSPSQFNLARGDLISRDISQTNDGAISLTGSAVNWTTDFGWYFDFNLPGEAGERVTRKPGLAVDEILGPVVTFTSIVPESSACAGGGHSGLFTIPLLSGLNPIKPILDIDLDDDFDLNDIAVGKRLANSSNNPNLFGEKLYNTSGQNNGITVDETNLEGGGTRTGRLGWQELITP